MSKCYLNGKEDMAEDDEDQNMTYEYWLENEMDARLEYLDFDEKYEMYLHWKNNEERDDR